LMCRFYDFNVMISLHEMIKAEGKLY
jgi:hypothetical protein